MNLLSTLYTGFSTLAAAADATPKPNDKAPDTPWIGSGGILEYWQIALLFVMIGLIGFLFYYRKKQQEE